MYERLASITLNGPDACGPIFFPLCCECTSTHVQFADNIELLRLDQGNLATVFGVENLKFDQFGRITGFSGVAIANENPTYDHINTLSTLTIGHPIERIGKWFNYCLSVPDQKSAQIFKLLALVTENCSSVPAFGLAFRGNPVPDQYILYHFPRSIKLAQIDEAFVTSWRSLYASLEQVAHKLNHFAFDKFIYAESKSVFNDSQSLYEHVCLHELLLAQKGSSNRRRQYAKRLAKFSSLHFGETEKERYNCGIADAAYNLRSEFAHGKNPPVEAEVLEFVRAMSRKLLSEYIHKPSSFSSEHIEFVSRQ